MDTLQLWSHQLDLAPRAASIYQAREFVRVHLALHELGFLTEDVVLVVSELTTNALAHAEPPLSMVLTAFEDTLLVSVRDGSPAGPIRLRAGTGDTTGRGLEIVEFLSRDWGVTPWPHAGKSVWAAFDVAPAADGGVV